MKRVSRRRFIQATTAVAATLASPWLGTAASTAASSRGRGAQLRAFVEPLPVPGNGMVIAAPAESGKQHVYTFGQREITRQLHPDLPPTPIWAYDDGTGLAGQAGSFGMLVVAQTGIPVSMAFTNQLPATYPKRIPVDTRLTPGESDQVRVLTHLHGGFVGDQSDGNPSATPHGYGTGQTQHVMYPNQAPQQPASLLWFHDHGPGTTRLNVFAGLAAGYLLRDAFDTGSAENANGLPFGAYEIPLVIQDRMFNRDGTFFYPVSDIPGVTWIGEYFGDVMLVNGKVWPYAEVEPRLYRFRILNGCNSRILTLDFGGAPMWQIGSEGGLFDRSVAMPRLVLAPAERADVLVDFANFANARLTLKNRKLQKPVVSPAAPLNDVMEFRVASRPRQRVRDAVPVELIGGRRAIVPEASVRRLITLNEIAAEESDWTLNINGAGFGENTLTPIAAGTVEEWVYVNLTGDTHPIHTHLVTFQVVGRTPFDADAYDEAYGGENGVTDGFDPSSFATGPMQPPEPEERGFKDTVKANPGYYTTIRAKFELPDGLVRPQNYVHHCHIVEHEDNDMMQGFVVSPGL